MSEQSNYSYAMFELIQENWTGDGNMVAQARNSYMVKHTRYRSALVAHPSGHQTKILSL
jgi:hypothetical protein